MSDSAIDPQMLFEDERRLLLKSLGHANVVTFPNQIAAECYLQALPEGYGGRAFKNEGGNWSVSYHFKGTESPDLSQIERCRENG